VSKSPITAASPNLGDDELIKTRNQFGSGRSWSLSWFFNTEEA